MATFPEAINYVPLLRNIRLEVPYVPVSQLKVGFHSSGIIW